MVELEVDISPAWRGDFQRLEQAVDRLCRANGMAVTMWFSMQDGIKGEWVVETARQFKRELENPDG